MTGVLTVTGITRSHTINPAMGTTVHGTALRATMAIPRHLVVGSNSGTALATISVRRYTWSI
jgi:hypothetical protein